MALTPFEGRPVLKSTIVLKNAGDGLSKVQKVQPVELHKGDEVWLVYRGVVEEVGFPPLKDSDGLARKHVVVAQEGFIGDAEVLVEHVADVRRRIAEEEAAEKRRRRAESEQQTGHVPLIAEDGPTPDALGAGEYAAGIGGNVRPLKQPAKKAGKRAAKAAKKSGGRRRS